MRKNPKRIRKLAIFDIDGTIFRSSLLIELVHELIQRGIFSLKVENLYIKSYNNWLNRKDSYQKYVQAVIKAFDENIKWVRYKEFLRIAQGVACFYQSRVYRYTRDLIKKLKKQNYYLLAISYSPEEIVKEFCRKLEFNKVYGGKYEISKQGRFTGKVLEKDFLKDKTKFLKQIIKKENLTLKGSLGVGDTESDIAFLKVVEKPICFNPNKELYKYAKQQGWQIVVERKDVIYKM